MQCLLIGNFGVGNLGDEALREYFLTAFPDVSWQVVSARPKADHELPRLPLGIRSFLRFDWLKTLRAYASADAVVFGGGSLLTDTESVMACVLWWWHTVPARVLRTDMHFAFQGVGPFRTRVGRLFARLALQGSRTISVRDEASYDRANSLVKNTKIVHSSDPVIWLIKNKKIDSSTKNVLILIPRKNSSEKFTTAAQKHMKSSDWERVVILSLDPQNATEKKYVNALRSKLDDSVEVVEIDNLSDLLHYVAAASMVVTERYHGALPAIIYGKPVDIVVQAPGDKLDALRIELPNADRFEQGAAVLTGALCVEKS